MVRMAHQQTGKTEERISDITYENMSAGTSQTERQRENRL